jgi:hypothetical protein
MYYGPMGYYRGFYGYYYRVWGYYRDPGYRVATGTLLWSGQSEAFTRNPKSETAGRYAKNVVGDLLKKRVIAP